MSDQIIFNPKDLIRSRAFNIMFARIFANQLRLSIWTVATRPTGDLLIQYRTYGFNTDFLSLEIYMGPSDGWILLGGTWVTKPDAAAPNSLALGSRGFNTTDEQSYVHNGTEWVISA